MIDIKKILDGNIVLHCKKKEDALLLVKAAHNYGLKWCGGNSYEKTNSWDEYKEETCYELGKGVFGSKNNWSSNEIIEFEKFKNENQEFEVKLLDEYIDKISKVSGLSFE